MNLFTRLNSTTAYGAVVLIRFMVGGVFLSEGLQKFLFPDANGMGRFAKIGMPFPEILAPFVGGVEIFCGTLIVLGLFTRLASLPLLIDISTAILSTKIPILLGHGFWHFSLPNLAQYGFWSMAHEARTDVSMLLGLLFLICVGAGMWSMDAQFLGRSKPSEPMEGTSI
jgi:uncharacterized membrane protein YphA (DoxX/SURF4 family)